MDEAERTALIILRLTKCPLCPNVIGKEAYHLLRDLESIERLKAHGTVLYRPDGPAMFLHERCYSSATLIYGRD